MGYRPVATLRVPLVLSCLLISACLAPDAGRGAGGTAPARPAAPKRLVAAIMAEPPALHRALIGGAITQAKEIAFNIVNIGLTVVDEVGVRRPTMAEAVPSLENGLWKMLPDGKMELIWKIRPGAAWHDGTPLTADDLAFTLKIVQDRETPEFRAPAGELIEKAEVVDAATLSTTWKRPFIRADYAFYGHSEGFAQPIPRHLLEPTYLESKDAFRQLPYWNQEFVGLGPYRLKEWVLGSHLLLEANDRYVLGRPKIDEMEIRFILDANTVAANILAGAVQATIGTGLALEQTLEVREQWRDGRLDVAYENWLVIYPQFVNPNPPIITDLQFRRALMMAIDRQAMVDTIQSGLVPIAHSYVRPDEREYAETERFVVRYEHDPRRAGQMIEGLGYTKGADGGFRDAAGQRLTVEIRASTSPTIHTKTMFPVADYWQRIGLNVEPLVIPVQATNDREYRATRPAFEVQRQPNGPTQVEKLHSSEAPMPENRFQGSGHSRYANPAFDALIEQYVATMPWEPRMQVLGQIVHHVSDQLNAMGLYYDLRTTLVGNQLLNVNAPIYPTWNVHLWELKG